MKECCSFYVQLETQIHFLPRSFKIRKHENTSASADSFIITYTPQKEAGDDTKGYMETYPSNIFYTDHKWEHNIIIRMPDPGLGQITSFHINRDNWNFPVPLFIHIIIGLSLWHCHNYV